MQTNNIARLYSRFGPVLGGGYLYLLSIIMLGFGIVGIEYAGYGPQLHAMWLLVYGGITMALCATLLLKGRTFGSLILFTATLFVLATIFDRAHAAFAGYGEASFDVPSWPPILLNVLIASVAGGSAIAKMASERRTLRSFSPAEVLSTWTLRSVSLCLILIAIAAFGPGLLAHQYSRSRIVGQWVISAAGETQGVAFASDGSYTDLRDGEVVATGNWIRDGSSAADVTINGVTAHYTLTANDQLCFSAPDVPSVCYDRVSDSHTANAATPSPLLNAGTANADAQSATSTANTVNADAPSPLPTAAPGNAAQSPLSTVATARVVAASTRSSASTPNAIFQQPMIAVLKTAHAAVLLPSWLPRDSRVPLVAQDVSMGDDNYSVHFDFGQNCHGINACSFGNISAKRGTPPFGSSNVVLANGTPAHFEPIHCGGSCGEAFLIFNRSGYQYTLYARVEKSVMLRIANGLTPLPAVPLVRNKIMCVVGSHPGTTNGAWDNQFPGLFALDLTGFYPDSPMRGFSLYVNYQTPAVIQAIHDISRKLFMPLMNPYRPDDPPGIHHGYYPTLPIGIEFDAYASSNIKGWPGYQALRIAPHPSRACNLDWKHHFADEDA